MMDKSVKFNFNDLDTSIGPISIDYDMMLQQNAHKPGSQSLVWHHNRDW